MEPIQSNPSKCIESKQNFLCIGACFPIYGSESKILNFSNRVFSLPLEGSQDKFANIEVFEFRSDRTAANKYFSCTDAALFVVKADKEGIIGPVPFLESITLDTPPLILFFDGFHKLVQSYESDLFKVQDLLQWALKTYNSILTLRTKTPFNPVLGNVLFGSYEEGWAFNINCFANFCSNKLNQDPKELASKLWGDHFYSSPEGKWMTEGTFEQSGFCSFVLQPFLKMLKEASKAIEEVEEEKEPTSKLKGPISEAKSLLHQLFSFPKSLLNSLVLCFEDIQKHKINRLQAITNSGMPETLSLPQRDTLIAVLCCELSTLKNNKKTTTTEEPEDRKYYLARIFNGNIINNTKYLLRLPNIHHESKLGLFFQKGLTLYAPSQDADDLVPATQISKDHFAILANCVGLPNNIFTTLTDSDDFHSVPLPRLFSHKDELPYYALFEPKNASDLPFLLKVMKQVLSKSPATLAIESFEGEPGGHKVNLASPEALVALNAVLNEKVPVLMSPITVSFKESITKLTPTMLLTKSPNKHSRFYATASPMARNEELFFRDEYKPAWKITPEFSKQLVENFEWDVLNSRKIWNLGSEMAPDNVLFDNTKGVQYLHEIKDSVYTGFSYACNLGPIMESNLKGVKVSLDDVTMYADVIHRGSGQIIPSIRRLVQACVLASDPVIREPMLRCEFYLPSLELESFSALLKSKDLSVLEIIEEKSDLYRLAVKVSCRRYIQESHEPWLKGKNVFVSRVCSWDPILGSIWEKGSEVADIVRKVRETKGMKLEIPIYTDFCDKL